MRLFKGNGGYLIIHSKIAVDVICSFENLSLHLLLLVVVFKKS